MIPTRTSTHNEILLAGYRNPSGYISLNLKLIRIAFPRKYIPMYCSSILEMANICIISSWLYQMIMLMKCKTIFQISPAVPTGKKHIDSNWSHFNGTETAIQMILQHSRQLLKFLVLSWLPVQETIYLSKNCYDFQLIHFFSVQLLF